VTGGGQAIGLACVDALPEAGAHVYIADYNDEVAAEGRAAMKATDYATDVIQKDVTKSSEVFTADARVVAEKGRIDILVCNAGVAHSEHRGGGRHLRAMARLRRRQSQRRFLVLPRPRPSDAVKWTRLSCRPFAANAARLQLHALAYNLGNFLRTLGTPQLNQGLVADEPQRETHHWRKGREPRPRSNWRRSHSKDFICRNLAADC